ncbi:MAG: NADAR family protein, partial [Cyclobacteriaceae bacterium]|nr:NADAR family protein [Cyclobacteriaceae bacterium]
MSDEFQGATVEELANFVNHGNKVKYVFFWGHKKSGSGISKSCFSQWYESVFTVDEKKYLTAEHFMMAEKARLFGDIKSEQKILAASNPGEAKKLGRDVIGFNEAR